MSRSCDFIIFGAVLAGSCMIHLCVSLTPGHGLARQALVNKVRELVEKEHEVFQAREKQKEALLEVRTEIFIIIIKS